MQSQVIKEIMDDQDFVFSDETQQLIFALIVISNILPIVFMIACMQLELKGNWDCLLCNILRAPNKGDNWTDTGSKMLECLQGN